MNKKGIIVNYHYVNGRNDGYWKELKKITTKQFENQIEYFKAQKYNFIGLGEYLNFLEGKCDIPDNFCILTFDDGISDHYLSVFPILKKHGVKGCFFPLPETLKGRVLPVHKTHILLASSSISDEWFADQINIHLKNYPELFEKFKVDDVKKTNADNQERLNKKYEMDGVLRANLKYNMGAIEEGIKNEILDKIFKQYFNEADVAKDFYLSEEQIKEMSDAGMDFGTHTISHPRLGLLDRNKQLGEIKESKEVLEKILDKEIDIISYPYGSFNNDTLDILKELNFRGGVTIKEDFNGEEDSRFLLNRFDTKKFPLDSSKKKLKIALLSSFTLDFLANDLKKECELLNLEAEFYIAPYNQYNQEILNLESGLYEFQPDIILISVDIKNLLGETFDFPYRKTHSERNQLKENISEDVFKLLQTIKNNLNSKIVFNNFEVPVYSSLGILENKDEYGLVEMIRDLNKEISSRFKKDGQVFVFDYDLFLSKIGKNYAKNPKMDYLADMKINPQIAGVLAKEYMSYIKPAMSLSKKCIVLDLDNTLWGGIIGEDGFEGIHLGTKAPGNAFVDFQKAILNLYERGVILAINSKNNPEDALKVIREHPNMVIREEHIAAMRINWNDKVSNIKSIAEELSIGLDSMVFIDDDKINREMMKEMAPEVLTVDLPQDPALYLQTLNEINDFNILQLTEEDKKKGEMYVAQRKRSEIEEKSLNLEDFLKNLEMEVTIEKANDFNIPRISQLTQKTNQFNVTTKRYLEEDIRNFVNDPNYEIYAIKVKDKFGDNGLTGLGIIKRNIDSWEVDTFLLSCRVLGRGIEKILLKHIIDEAKMSGVSEIKGAFISTAKNKPAFSFFKEYMVDENNWKISLNKAFLYPSWVKINIL